ncbi:sulfur oxidation c-type cytochrome SoxA [Roseiterribacter gracilis]|uniref:L-cysteine S-thiosulfotransferase subunit SoxA n=1 Tax=Roseiterribacter gracilis TaxID=2812848 RepID=A0A8S8XI25_9PROT|nr:SoxAX cytochrome complex subunit A [Rhodospirillales bacterium TMPK1]
MIRFFVVALLAFAAVATAQKKSGYEFSSRETQAMQDDDAANPGFLWVQQGETLWNRRDGAAGKSCADCHGEANNSVRGVAARYPVFAPEAGAVIDIEQRINRCRTEHQQAKPLAYESDDLLALTSFVGKQSRAMSIDVAIDARARSTFERGKTLFEQRQGQINLSCSQCHDDNWGKQLAGSPIPQAHPTGYPAYRLEWQTLGSLRRRLRNCLIGMRAEAPPYESADYVALELFLMARAKGLAIDTPSVRR